MLLFANCNKDCVKSAGKMATKEFAGLSFKKILVNKGIGLVITQGSDYKVEVSSGENLIGDIEVKVIDGMLVLEDHTTCNWIRDYGQTVVYVTAPDLTDIFCKTEQNITSNGILAFPFLHLVSMDSNDGFAGAGTGDYSLQVNNQSLLIENNNVSRYYISGNTNQLSVNFYEAGGVFRGENLTANDVRIFHRGSNDIYVWPVNSISGDIYNIGNVISMAHPPLVQVTEHYRGRLIFN